MNGTVSMLPLQLSHILDEKLRISKSLLGNNYFDNNKFPVKSSRIKLCIIFLYLYECQDLQLCGETSLVDICSNKANLKEHQMSWNYLIIYYTHQLTFGY